MRRSMVVLVSFVLLAAGLVAAPAVQAAPKPKCGTELLILSAFPAEMGKIVSAAGIDPYPIDAQNRDFWTGVLEHHKVIIGLTGIGPANATLAMRAAFARFNCEIAGVIFSGTAGGGKGTNIGDVTVPSEWTGDGGHTFVKTTPSLLAIAKKISSTVALEQKAPLGDPTCLCSSLATIPVLSLPAKAVVHVGGIGSTSDPFAGHAVPCVPYGGDLVGCAPCTLALHQAPNTTQLFQDLNGILSPSFLEALVAPQSGPSVPAISYDDETAIVAAAAAAHHVPFIGFRAVSDTGSEAQFEIYKQVAADNAGEMTLAFLHAWKGVAVVPAVKK